MNTLKPSLLAALAALALTACPPPPGSCATTGNGSIVVTFAGLPSGVNGSVTVMGASSQTLTMGQTLMVTAGNWGISAEKVIVDDPLVRTVYTPRISAPNFCLAKDATQAVDVTWSVVKTSNALWVGNGSGGMGSTQGFAATALRTSGTLAPSYRAELAASRSIAFDKDGNIWALGNTVTDPLVARFPAEGFTMGSAPMPDRSINIPALTCVPATKALAFDKDGNLYVASSCKKELYKLPAASLGASGTVTPSLTIATFQAIDGLAFDKAGNLWVADGVSDELLRFDASALTGTSASPTRRIKARKSDQPADLTALKPDMLAFDKDGNLWSYDFGLNLVFSVAAADLSGSGMANAIPTVRISIPVSAVLEGLAFDEGGGLWLPYSAGKLARLSPAQLTVSSGAGAPTMPDTIITASSIGSAQGPAIYPAPKGTPLFHALP